MSYFDRERRCFPWPLVKSIFVLNRSSFLEYRCRKLYVESHQPGYSFKVKLGEPGLPNYADLSKHVHWLPMELLFKQMVDKKPIEKNQLSIESEVWSVGTTLWQIFSHGAEPSFGLSSADPSEIANSYIRGDVLPRPLDLPASLSALIIVSHRVPF